MQCPIDQTTLVMTSRDGVEIDYCPRCRGVWLDRGELDKIIDRLIGGDDDYDDDRYGDPRYAGREQDDMRGRRYEDGPQGHRYEGEFQVPRRGREPQGGPMQGEPYEGPAGPEGQERYPPTGPRRRSILDIFNV